MAHLSNVSTAFGQFFKAYKNKNNGNFSLFFITGFFLCKMYSTFAPYNCLFIYNASDSLLCSLLCLVLSLGPKP